MSEEKRKSGRPRTKPIVEKEKRSRGRPRKEVTEAEIQKQAIKLPRGRPRKYPPGESKPPKELHKYYKNGRVSKFDKETYEEHIENHCELIRAIHRYYIEMETWCNKPSLASSKIMYFWLMRILKQVQIRRLQIKQYQNCRDPRFGGEIYTLMSNFEESQRIDNEIEQEINAAIKHYRAEAGLPDE